MGEIEFVYSISNRVFCSHKFLTFLLARICVCVCVGTLSLKSFGSFCLNQLDE